MIRFLKLQAQELEECYDLIPMHMVYQASKIQMMETHPYLADNMEASIRYHSIWLTLNLLSRRGYDVFPYEPEAHVDEKDPEDYQGKLVCESDSVDMKIGVPEHVSQIENLTQIDGLGKNVNDFEETFSPHVDVGQKEELTMSEFFARPVELASISIVPGTDVTFLNEVWDSWSKKPAVRAKLKNFSYFKGTLVISLVLTGNPFQACSLIGSYKPFRQLNGTLGAYSSLIGGGLATARQGLLNYLSQSRDGSLVYMDVKKNQTYEMRIPFFFHKPVAKLFNNDIVVLPAASSYEDLELNGTLYVYSLVTPRTSGSISNATLQVYAHMENVDLGPPTGTVLELLTESDERKEGPFESVASSTLDVINALDTVPMLSPLTTPSKIIATGFKKLCALYGWSKPELVGNPMFIKNRPFANGAQLSAMETSKKITADPLQEMGVGSSIDELSIQRLCNNPTYLTSFTWSPGDPVEIPIWQVLVNPALATRFSGVNTYTQPTPMAMAAQLFQYWRGDITFKFDVITTNYDRGKFMISWEPNSRQNVLISTDLELNKQFKYVVDLQDVQSMSFCVKWATHRPWLLLAPYGEADDQYGTTIAPGFEALNCCNGVLSFSPFTSLTNNDNASVEVVVWVYSEDMHFNQIINQMPSNRLLTESSVMTEEYFENVECVDINPSSSTMDNVTNQYFGEEVLSLRSVFKRFITSKSLNVSSGLAGDTTLTATINCFPVPHPNYGVFSSVLPSPLRNVQLAFAAMRGSMKYRAYFRNGSVDNTHTSRIVVTLDEPVDIMPLESLVWTNQRPNTAISGSVSFVPCTNGGVEFTIPFYTNNLFIFPQLTDYIGAMAPSSRMETKFTKSFSIYMEGDRLQTDNSLIIDEATGEDFNLLWFTGAPFSRI